MADGDTEIITLSSDDESKAKIVTSPKLSLRRKRDGASPENKNSGRTGDSTLHLNSKRMKLEHPDCASFYNHEQLCLNEVQKQEENRLKFIEFLEYSKTLMEETSEEEKATIEKRIVHQLNSTQQWYLCSKNFNSLLDDSWSKLREDSSNTFPVLYEMKQELKKYKSKFKSIPNGKEMNREQPSFSFKNTISKGNAFFSPNTSNDSCPISEATKNNIEYKKSGSQFVDSFFSSHSTVKSTVTNHVMKEKDLCPKATITSASALRSESSQDSVFIKNIICEKAKIFPSSQRKSVDNKSDFPSTSRPGSSTETAFKENHFDSLSVPSCSSSSKSNVQSFAKKEDEKHSFLVASTSGLCSSKIAKPSAFIGSVCEKKVLSDCKPVPSTSYASLSGNNDVESVEGNDGPSVKPMSVEDQLQIARINKLEKFLVELDKAIKKIQQKELTLDDMDDIDSAYIKEDKYKKRFNRVWKQLCQLKKVSSRTGRIVEKRFKYKGSRYKVINSAIQKLIDKKKPHEKFPDFMEVLSTLKQVNDTHQMGLSEKDISIEAERVFKDVGEELQIRRCRDDKELFGCYLTDDIHLVEDPAEKDENLMNTLTENNKKFEARINEIIDNFAEQQQKMANSGDANQEESSDDDGDEEEEDEDNQGKAYNVEEDLPLTDPASPDVGDKCKKETSDDEIMEIQSDSDPSTEPTDEIEEQIVKKRRNSLIKTAGSNDSNTVVIEDSIDLSSSDDLPDIADLLTR